MTSGPQTYSAVATNTIKAGIGDGAATFVVSEHACHHVVEPESNVPVAA